MFRGREQCRPELGYRLLQRLAEDVTELGFVEAAPKQDGRNMIMVLGRTGPPRWPRPTPRSRPPKRRPTASPRPSGGGGRAGDHREPAHQDTATVPRRSRSGRTAAVAAADRGAGQHSTGPPAGTGDARTYEQVRPDLGACG